jgi:hypothetical protein
VVTWGSMQGTDKQLGEGMQGSTAPALASSWQPECVESGHATSPWARCSCVVGLYLKLGGQTCALKILWLPPPACRR